MGFPWAIAAGSASSAANIYGQMKANEQNIKLARENRGWEEEMSNTAIQRRRKDIEAAGGNPALAFTNGEGASTPTANAPTVEPLDYGQIAGKMMTALQMSNMKAQTEKLQAETRITNVEANNKEKFGGGMAELEWEMKIGARDQQEWTTKILGENYASSAAEAQQKQQLVRHIVEQARQAVEKGDLEVKQLRNIVNMGGLSPEDQDSVLRYLMDVIFRGK